jgi:hypothetical protein
VNILLGDAAINLRIYEATINSLKLEIRYVIFTYLLWNWESKISIFYSHIFVHFNDVTNLYLYTYMYIATPTSLLMVFKFRSMELL